MKTALNITVALLMLLVYGCGSKREAIVGPTGLNGAKGEPGVPGATGPQGARGENGHSLLVLTASATPAQCAAGGVILVIAEDTNDNGVLDSPDSSPSTSILCNGAAAPFTPVEYITPCGPESSAYKEILLRMADGSVLGSFSQDSSALTTRLALLPDGSYVDTDQSSCAFTLSTSGATRTIAWSGGGESWAIAP